MTMTEPGRDTSAEETREGRDTITGSRLLARSLASQGVEHMFGIVGFPVYDVARSAQKEGLGFYGFRNEQAASYAAGAVGYLTKRPGCCLAVSGPGVVHALAGLANAQANCWPMVLIGGANDSFQNGAGAFQEMNQVEAARPFVKYAARPDSLARIPYYVEQAIRTSLYGRPGPVYLDVPNDLLVGEIDAAEVELPSCCPEAPKSLATPESIDDALCLLREARRPLVIVGKGAAYARAEGEVRSFVERTGLPFLATPMGKGVVPDDHPQSMAPARSHALRRADVILLIGARLNWILHFGRPPRFADDLRVIQIDCAAEEMGANVAASAALLGDAGRIVGQLNARIEQELAGAPESTLMGSEVADWMAELEAKADENRGAVDLMMDDDSEPLGYYRVLREIRDAIPADAMIVAEGANTMDISRTVLGNGQPRSRLDAGSFGTMGVGLPQAIAAAVAEPGRRVVAVQGDSAFGFSGMETEVACRFNLPITVIIINNNGIASGVAELDREPLPPWVYTPRARYEKLADAFGGKGWFVDSLVDLRPALDAALAEDGPSIVNVMIDPKATRKPQKFGWLTR